MSDSTVKESCLKCLYGMPYRVAMLSGKMPSKEALDKRCATCIEIVHRNFHECNEEGEK